MKSIIFINADGGGINRALLRKTSILFRVIYFSIFLMGFLFFNSCKKQNNNVFSGIIVSNFNKPVAGAIVNINGETTRTDDKGFFKQKVKLSRDVKNSIYIMNVTKDGYGLLSKIYQAPVPNGKWTMTKGMEFIVDIGKDFTVTQKREIDGKDKPCTGSVRSQVDWKKYRSQRFPKGITEKQKAALEYADDCKTCNPGISLSMKANSLVDSKGNRASGKVKVTLAAVDIYDADSMPGDFTVRDGNEYKFMEPFGAGTVRITTEDGRVLQPKKDFSAVLTVPINPAQLKAKGIKIEDKIPLLLYNEKEGVWVPSGEGKFDKKKNAYIGELHHFSSYNMDLIKKDPGCIQVNCAALGEGNFSLTISGNYAGGSPFTPRTRIVANTATCKTHIFFNLPAPTATYPAAIPITVSCNHPIDGLIERTTNITAKTSCSAYQMRTHAPDTNYYTDCCGNAIVLEKKKLKIINLMDDGDGTCSISSQATQVVQVRVGYFGDAGGGDLGNYVRSHRNTEQLSYDIPNPSDPSETCNMDTDTDCCTKVNVYQRIACGQDKTFMIDPLKYDPDHKQNYYVYIGIGYWSSCLTQMGDGGCGKVLKYSDQYYYFGHDSHIYDEYTGTLEIEIRQNSLGIPTATGYYTNLSLAGTKTQWFPETQLTVADSDPISSH